MDTQLIYPVGEQDFPEYVKARPGSNISKETRTVDDWVCE